MKFSSILLLVLFVLGGNSLAQAQCSTDNLAISDTLVVSEPIDSSQTLKILGKHVKEVKLLLYSRMGKKLFESSSSIIGADATSFKEFDTGWDGTYQGQHLSEGLYVYMIEAQCADANRSTVRKSGTIILTNRLVP
jgi:hypothetical protein